MKRNSISTKLEVENKKMEDRLQVLKQMMSAEKARRELDGGILWESGKPGPLRVSNSKYSSLSSSTIPHNLPVKANPKKPIRVKFLSDKSNGELKPGEKPVLQCGQCERSSATLTCVECIENYCQLCFAKMHQKGRLAKHHVKPILRKVKPVLPKSIADVADTAARKASVAVDLVDLVPPATETVQSKHNSLLVGTYDEAGNAQSFQDALTEWRSGNKGSKECNTYSSHGVSTEPVTKISTTTGGVQAGEGSILQGLQQKIPVVINFPDTNRVSYFEKLLIRRHRESLLNSGVVNPLLSQGEPVETQEEEVEKMEEEREEEEGEETMVNTISEFNIFYDDEDMVLPDNTDLMDDAILDDFNGITCMPSNEVLIGNMSIFGDHVEMSGSNDKEDHGQNVQPTKKPVSSSKPKEKDKLRSKAVTVRGKKHHDEKRVHSSKKRKSKGKQTDSLCSQDDNTHQLGQSDLATSVQAVWSSCAQGNAHNHLLTNFFLHAVGPTNDSKENLAMQSQLHSQTTAMTTFSLGQTTWVPNSSIAQEYESSDKLEDASCTSDERPSTRLERRDAYYNNSESDSEPENERELFLSSRLGSVHESIEFGRDSRAASSYQDLEQEEEELERDRADCDALEDLACELQASTVELERCQTATKQREVKLEEEEEDEGGEMDQGLSEDSVGDVNMTKVMSEFDLFQRELLDQDSD